MLKRTRLAAVAEIYYSFEFDVCSIAYESLELECTVRLLDSRD